MPWKSEERCIALFCEILGTRNVLKQHGFDDLRYPTVNRKISFDAFFPEFNLLLEYDGKQHTENVTRYNKKPGRKEKRKMYDEMRNEYARTNGFRMIRFPHSDPITKERVMEKLREAGVIL